MRENTRPITRLIFVYAADSGRPAAVLDSVRKLLRMQACTLCAITHGLFGERPRWRRVKEDLGVPVEYVHRNELAGPLAEVVAGRLPCVVARTAEGRHLLLGPEVIGHCHGSLADLRARLREHTAMQGLEVPGLAEKAASESTELP